MPGQTIVDRIKKIFLENISSKSDLEDIYSGVSFNKIASLDSLELLKIMVALEKEFKIKFDFDDLEKAFHDINTMEQYIASRKND